MFNFLKGFKKSPEEKKEDDVARGIVKAKYQAFQRLLSTNNQVLELMADMEEKVSGEYLFDIQYIKTNVRLIGYEVSKLIESLDALSNNKYSKFLEIYTDISREIEKILEYKMEITVSDLTIPLENLSGNAVGIAGGKIAHLGEVKSSLNLPTPDGFVISAYAFIKFMDHNRLIDKISERMSSVNIEVLEELNKFSKAVYHMIVTSEIPPDLQEAIENSYAKLCKKLGGKPMVSVRSSAIREDSEFSFAGQYATFLNVPGDAILQKYKEVVASLFTPRAIFYSKTKGFSEGEMVMAVGVLNMVDAIAGGVMYSRDPNDSSTDHVLINAVHGLGVWVVDGTVTPDTYTVSRHPEGTIIDKNISSQEKMLVNGKAGKLEEVLIPEDKRGKQCLADEHIKVLAKHALALETYYGSPQDIEWAVGSDGKIYILQSRPLRILMNSTSGACLPTRFDSYKIILDKGVIACKGVGFGKAFILKDDEGLNEFPEGAVLIAKHTSPKFVTIMNKASAIITDVGSATGHMASLSREYQVPTILDTEVSTSIIQHGQEITVDAINCNIYEGQVSELLEYARNKKEPYKETHLFKTLEKVLKWVVPLNLTDPDHEYFSPENCRTYHDITRFAHEVAMHEMFSVGEDQDNTDAHAIDLVAGIPVGVRLLNINGGVKENLKKATFDDVLSIPLIALLKGMKTMRWPGPPPVDAKGFLGMLAHSASVPEEQLQETAKKSFAVVSGHYVNFSIRLGYHFSMIEAYAGENINDNYIKFFFKGGGAAIDRRLRRVRLIKEILKELGFRVKITEDVVDAILTKYKQSTIEDKLIVMGKFTAYTKQLDMAMFNDAVTDMYIDQFIKEHIHKPRAVTKT
jgi:pyruvate, water dikinase